MPSSDNAFPPRSKTFSYSSANKTRINSNDSLPPDSPTASGLPDPAPPFADSSSTPREVLRCVTRGDRAFPPALRLKRTATSTPAAASAFATASRSPTPDAPPLTFRALINCAAASSNLSTTPTLLGTLAGTFIRRFLRNCDVCGRSKVWRSYRATLLRSLPTLDQFYRYL
ncbi:hypothetical protein L249_6600 [Ophiocordyceps polyrhachis-furcata BCC 54312]|uniref:Uncharacterized protein n=1 Tax=Ophiocordyceps polyrhachis-furcata BCC 54312 TaxID=1330021 RepID=A0A367LLJ4_9HYPO|nr:hypothetical protein L249_6600 [Ophiocordyceps polyrhachis-furcata BCC 54312]